MSTDFSAASERIPSEPGQSGASRSARLELLTWCEKEKIPHRTGVLGREVTTLKIGGELGVFVEVQNIAQLAAAVRFTRANRIPLRVLGFGSNLLIPDDGVSGAVMRLAGSFREWESGNGAGKFTVGGASPLMTLCRTLGDAGWSGIEFAAGIPASIGGAAFMNAGAHGGEMSSIVASISILTEEGEEALLAPQALAFRYRSAGVPAGAIVTAIELQLARGDAAAIRAERAKCLEYRKLTQPLTLPSAGSIFRNPSKAQAAGMLLERSGAKGMREGGVEISRLHANWIVNPDRAGRAVEVNALIQRCQGLVRAQCQVELEPELVRW